jgi:hypothetical protein
MPGIFQMSPEVQAYGNQQQPQGPEAMEQMFKQRFSDMAYQVMFSRFADLAPSIVTFKILNMDATQGDALGVFILVKDGLTVYIPAVLGDSRLKPLEILYSKNLGIFLPLSTAWINELARLSLSEMGRGQDMPPGAATDVNIRNLVQPPTAEYGRVGYADDAESDIPRMLRQLTKRAEASEMHFLDVISAAPKVALDGLKLAFEKNPSMFSKLASCYGKTALIQAMQSGYTRNAAEHTMRGQIKQAVLELNGSLDVLTKTASKEDLKRVFGKMAGEAFSTIRQYGLAIKDTRVGLDKIAVEVEGTVSLSAPGPGAGWLRIYSLDGPAENYLAVPLVETPSAIERRMEVEAYHNPDPFNPKEKAKKFLVISKDMAKIFVSDKVVGDPLFPSESNGLLKAKISKYFTEGDTPAPKDYGFFINPSPRGLQCTEPFVVSQVIKANGISTVTADGEPTMFVRGAEDQALKGKIVVTHTETGGTRVFLPNDAHFVKIPGAKGEKAWEYKRKMTQFVKSIITDPTRFRSWLKSIFKDAGAAVAGVKHAGHNEWWIDGHSHAFTLGEALQKVATMYHLSIDDSTRVLNNAQKYGHANTYILDKTAMDNLGRLLYKLSAETPQSSEAPIKAQPDQPGSQGGDPQQAQQQAPAPAPISPTDLAIGEALQNLTQQNQLTQQQNQAQMEQMKQKMDMEMQQNQALMQVLQGIQQRSMALSGASNGQIPAGAEQSPQVAAQAIAPVPPPQPPPPAFMEQGDLSPEQVQQQVNPSFVEQAAGLQDQGTMDAGAIAMVASAPVFQDITASYIPQLEKALDNLGRVLLTLWVKERETKENVGDEAFTQLEDRLRNLFKNMGELVLQLNKYSSAQSTSEEQPQAT